MTEKKDELKGYTGQARNKLAEWKVRVWSDVRLTNDAGSVFEGVILPRSGNFDDLAPLVEWPGHTGCVTITYVAPLEKYVMCVTEGGDGRGLFDTYILESDALTGPWRMVTYMKDFGTQAYFVNVPAKFVSPDGRTAWLCYSANYTNQGHGTNWPASPPGSRYAMCLHEFEFQAGRATP